MEVDQGPNWGRSAKKKSKLKYVSYDEAANTGSFLRRKWEKRAYTELCKGEARRGIVLYTIRV
jgi:hypothetical protein